MTSLPFGGFGQQQQMPFTQSQAMASPMGAPQQMASPLPQNFGQNTMQQMSQAMAQQKPMMPQPMMQQPMISDMRYTGPQQQQTPMQQIGQQLRGFGQQPFTQPQPQQQPTAGLGAAFNQFNAQQAMKPMVQPPPPPAQPVTPPRPQAPQGYNAGQQYQDFGNKLAGMIQSGQLTPQRANELKASVFEATRLGNTPEGQAAMQRAIAASTGQLPMQGYNASQQYQDFGKQLAGMIQSGQLTPQRANELKAAVYEASRLGNTNAGNAAMQKALADSRGKLPMQGYNSSQQYQDFGKQLAGMIQSGKLTPQQANALKNPVYEATRLGNTNAGYEAMQKALTSARGQMGTPAPMQLPQTPQIAKKIGYNDGGYVGMAPPNPYFQQVGQEDPRMQAMRNMQQMNLGGDY